MSVTRAQGIGGFSDINRDLTRSVTEDQSNRPEKSDVQWFSAALQPVQKTDASDNVAERIVSQLSGSSEHLQKLENKANRALNKASKSSDPMDIVHANRSLSSFYLESLLTTKLISKGAQAVEKLTNLQ
ncbi:type III secretion system inner rod subunit SctI [Vibrio mangrovi]|uniref:Type III secretion needle MxiH like protein n=1 Tax=Vibrio mangrovi TaxID=474394 RepID=A0A1Y6J0A1_9VIBR|nr:type III secretion system inner rod subunit SctI [Vibrio mangrovi]MDW6001952.1 type III secretion system inner rod subunit SctI [Vibrio mangrovi]SMS02500.1 Type III secretion needle MxiH like protein [Vibrio mangrovi]